MSRIVRKHTVYAAWDYEREVDDLNKLSAEGLQLVKGGCFSSKYEKDQSVQYRYQIDYNRCIDNKMRYIESFREQGWEYINSTFNGWHYFRKINDPSLPESEYEIYTDIPSRSEMAGRWLKMGYMLGIFVFLIFLLMVYRMICRPELWKLGVLAEYGIIGVMLACGLRGMVLVAKGNTSDRKRKFPFHLVIVLLVAAFLWSLIWMQAKETQEGTWIGNVAQKDDYPIIEFDIKLPEFIYLTMENDCDLPTTVTIVDEAGNMVFTRTGEALQLEEEKIFLSRGSYQLMIDYNTENLNEEEMNFQIELKMF